MGMGDIFDYMAQFSRRAAAITSPQIQTGAARADRCRAVADALPAMRAASTSLRPFSV